VLIVAGSVLDSGCAEQSMAEGQRNETPMITDTAQQRDGVRRNPSWWRTAVIYQIYPRSYGDTTGDGRGDLDGITRRLPYLSALGVDAIWLNPFYASPMIDGGYDIADHTAVDPSIGDLDAFDRLVSGAHAVGLRVLVDFVPNHTSDRHPWFQASRSSRDDPRRSWYIWADGRDGGPPNNWVSAFGGSAWTFDEHTGQWYLHTFLPEQPDLNWRDPDVESAMLDVLRFWLDRGVDGFRIDVANFVLKDPGLRDNPPRDPATPTDYRPLGAYDTQVHLYDKGHPDVHALYRRIRRHVDRHRRGGADECVLLGELHTFDLPDWLDDWAAYYGTPLDELHLPLNLALVGLRLDAARWRRAVDRVEAALPDGAWPTLVLGSHDEPRVASRLGPRAAPLAMTALLTLRGTPILYYGDEIGMTDVAIPDERRVDLWDTHHAGGSSVDVTRGSSGGSSSGRDPQRTPMQWTAGPNAGFAPTDAVPWLPIGDNAAVNVAAQAEDPSSMLGLTRRLLELRRSMLALATGSYRPIDAGPDILAWIRQAGPQLVLVALNFADAASVLELPAPGRLLLRTRVPSATATPVSNAVTVGPLEAIVIEVFEHRRPGH
jgi:alpha-glucosidase